MVTGERLCGLDGGGRVLCEGRGLPLDKPATQLTSTSPSHSEDLLCVLLDGGEVACTYPYFSAGLAGHQAIDLSLSYQTILIVTVEGQIVGSWGQKLSDKIYQDVAAGVGFGCALDMSRGLTCFDFVNEAEIRRAPPGEYPIVFEAPDGHFTAVYASDQSDYAPFCVLNNVGQATCWWLRNAEDRPIDDPKDARAVEAFAPDSRFFELAIGLRETCGIDERRRVVCWEHTAASDSMPTLSTPLEAEALAIAVGTNGVDLCILDELGLPQCWTP